MADDGIVWEEPPAAGPTPEAVQAWVAASCAAQGVPEKVTDPVVIRKVAVLLGVGDG